MSRSTISTFQLFELFPDQESARLYLESRLWPDGVRCPACHSGDRITVRKRGFYRCNACGSFDFTWRTGTIFERSHVTPQKTIAALYAFGQEPDIVPREFASVVGITDKTACLLLRKLREAAGELFDTRLDLDNPDYRVVPGFPAYRVGLDGSIWTRWKRSKRPRLGWTWEPLKAYVNEQRGGYRYVMVYDGRASKRARVSRLVCEAFHGPCPPDMECNHRDGNQLNDAAENLFWGTHSENMDAAKSHGRMRGGTACGERNGNAKLTDAQLAEIISLRGKVARRYVSKRFNISPTRVSQIWKAAVGKRITYKELTA